MIDPPVSKAKIAGHPIHPMLVPFPIACFVLTLITDIIYAKTADMQWANMSAWLLTFGLLVAALAAIAGLIDFIGERRIRELRSAWIHAVGNALAIVLSIFNAFVHSRDAYTSVVPTGLTLSAIVVLILLVTGWNGWAMVYRHRVGMAAGRAGMRTIRLALLAASVSLSACDAPKPIDPHTQIGANPVLPEIHQYLMPPMNVPKSVGWSGMTPTVPAGLQVKALATDLKSPRSLYVLPNGDVLVVESGGPEAPVHRPKEFIMNLIEKKAHSSAKPPMDIILFRDADGDGVAETRSVFLEHLNSPFGIVLVGNDFYVANTDGIVRYPYETGQTKITGPGEKLTDLPGGPIDHHWTKSLTASPDGTKLYAGVGSNSNITENGIGAELGRASIWEIDRVTGAHREFATGLRNPNGLQFEPQTNVLWAVINERDELGPDLVPDYLTSVKDGAFYGWPYSYYGQHIDPRVQPQRPDLVAKATPPDYALSSHVAPLGMVFYTGDSLPETYRGGAFVGEHGSWDRQELNGYKVVYVPFANGGPNGMAQDVVTGFLTKDGEIRGRPVGLAIDKRGALLVADDVGGAVWRVSAARN